MPEEDLQEQIHYQSIERIEDIHAQFFDQFIEFKDKLSQHVSTIEIQLVFVTFAPFANLSYVF